MTIRGGEVFLADCDVPVRADLSIHAGRIQEIGIDLGSEGKVIDAGGLHVAPGGIDPHVHFNDPGYTHREDFLHGTMAAASGGVTTVIDMPFTSQPPVTSLANLEAKLDVVAPKAAVDFGFHAGVCAESYDEAMDGALERLVPLVLGIKCYAHSSMAGLGSLDYYRIGRLLDRTAEWDRPLLVHAEDHGFVDAATEYEMRRGSGPLQYYRSRPEAAEVIAVAAVCELALGVQGNLHVVHVGCKEAARIISEARHRAGSARVSGETAPHYLAFNVEDFLRLGSSLKVAPSVKSPGNPEALWDSLREGGLSFAASDHAPAPEREKSTGSIWEDYGGIPGGSTLLPYLYSAGFRSGRLTAARFVEVTARAAARRYGIDDRKGGIEVGKDADLVLIDPAGRTSVRGSELLSLGSVTPFEGAEFAGRVVQTMVRGEIVFDSQRGVTGRPGYGKMIVREGREGQ